jgi:hypothetical protein
VYTTPHGPSWRTYSDVSCHVETGVLCFIDLASSGSFGHRYIETFGSAVHSLLIVSEDSFHSNREGET